MQKIISQPLIDLKIQYKNIRSEINAAVQEVLSRTDFILGKEVREFEEACARYLNVNHAVGVASGTDALVIALDALDIGEGDEVITTPFTFIATAEAIHRVGAKPVFADINRRTLLLDPKEVQKKITARTKAVIPVHLYGQPVEMDELRSLCGSTIHIIEDCAQSMGAVYKGKKTGSIGTAGCFSFFPGKNLGCYGDGGLIAVNRDDIAEKVRLLRNHGSRTKYEHCIHGYNSRLDTLQAAVLMVKLAYLDRWNEKRRRIAEQYREALLPTGISFPEGNAYTTTSMNYFTCIVPRKRDELSQYLTERGIANCVYYPRALHLQKAYDFLGYRKGDFPHTEEMQDTVLSLPMYPELHDDQICCIADTVTSFYQ